MPLLHPEGYAVLVLDVVPRNHGEVRLLVASPLWKLAWYLLVLREGHSGQCQLRILWVLFLKYMLSSATGPYLLPLGSNEGKQQWTMFWESLVQPDQQHKRGSLVWY